MIKNLIYEGKENKNYLISDDGRIFNSDGHEMTQFKTNAGYMRVKLSRGIKRGMYLVHRLVAMTFIDNPNEYPIINHKDNDRCNNDVKNLEWCNNSYNQKQRFKSCKGTKARLVAQITLDGKFVRLWNTPKDVFNSLGIQAQNISKVCRGERKQAGGYKWVYE